MRVVLDTNILVSATFWIGASNKIIKNIENKEIQLILSSEIIQEFSDVLNYEEIQNKIKDKKLEMQYSVEKIISIATIIQPIIQLNVIEEDPDDNIILECAIEGNADYIISYDKCLLNLKEFKGIKILTPEEFLRIFENEH